MIQMRTFGQLSQSYGQCHSQSDMQSHLLTVSYHHLPRKDHLHEVRARLRFLRSPWDGTETQLKKCAGTETDAENRKTIFALGIPILSFPAFPTLASFLFSPFQAPRPACH